MAHIGIDKYFLLLLGLLNGKRAYTGPLFADVDITRRCNLKCLGCPYHDVKKDMKCVDKAVLDISFELVERLAGELQTLGTQGVVFCGTGEPLLHPRLTDIVYAFHAAGLETQLFTNGTLLNEERAVGLVNAGLDRLIVSLWGGNPEEYTRFLPASGKDSFTSILKSIARLKKIKIKRGKQNPAIFLHHVCSAYTCDHIESKIALARETGCDGIVFSPFINHGGRGSPAALNTLQIDSLVETLKKFSSRMDKAALGHNLDNLLFQLQRGARAWMRLPCYIAWYQTRIRVDGAVMPCTQCNLILGDLNNSSLKEIWSGAGYRRFRTQLMRRGGLAALQTDCKCDWCCYFSQNYRVHRIFKWLAPFTGNR